VKNFSKNFRLGVSNKVKSDLKKDQENCAEREILPKKCKASFASDSFLNFSDNEDNTEIYQYLVKAVSVNYIST